MTRPKPTQRKRKRQERVAIIFDGHKWYLRRIRVIEHDLDRDEKVYRCDVPMGEATRLGARVLRALVAGTFEP